MLREPPHLLPPIVTNLLPLRPRPPEQPLQHLLLILLLNSLLLIALIDLKPVDLGRHGDVFEQQLGVGVDLLSKGYYDEM